MYNRDDTDMRRGDDTDMRRRDDTDIHPLTTSEDRLHILHNVDDHAENITKEMTECTITDNMVYDVLFATFTNG